MWKKQDQFQESSNNELNHARNLISEEMEKDNISKSEIKELETEITSLLSDMKYCPDAKTVRVYSELSDVEKLACLKKEFEFNQQSIGKEQTR